ncbi:hypothetical protein HPB50_000313 [Hyalomma asiaticum]|uniref:Uncharacterized protein n=1 Tax=Hyalomma asiaticum TaxID=266040 RepID=A0ACB7RTF7_HYAAI|nr:hypothetical protein HPB50_000313 [Hyalomma asiaticum]
MQRRAGTATTLTAANLKRAEVDGDSAGKKQTLRADCDVQPRKSTQDEEENVAAADECNGNARTETVRPKKSSSRNGARHHGPVARRTVLKQCDRSGRHPCVDTAERMDGEGGLPRMCREVGDARVCVACQPANSRVRPAVLCVALPRRKGSRISCR